MASTVVDLDTPVVRAPRASVGTRRPASYLRRQLVVVAIVLLAIMAVEQFELTPAFPMTRMLMQTQDVPVLILVAVLLLALAAWPVPTALGRVAERLSTGRSIMPVVVVLGAGLVAILGTRYIAGETPVSHDEVMAQFDTAILSSGRLMAPIPPEWRSHSWALEPVFRVPVPGDVAWVSTYLPGNAAVRAALGKIFDPAVVNGILVAGALFALYGVARQLWPARREAAIIAVVLGATSSQVLGMGMTPFAMTAHLVLNLVWLWLFLRNTATSHAAAITVGFLATGLHQLIFHPLFVAPFILQMLVERRWKLGAVYSVCYAAIGLFWIFYWQLLLAGHGIQAEAAKSLGLSFFIARVAGMLADISVSGPETMVQNLLRFAAWQHPMMLVLLAPGLVLGWKAGGTLRALVGGIVLTLVAMLILLPYQDIGWGYRYVHGLIGSTALLSAFAWTTLTARADRAERRSAWGAMAVATAAAVVVLLPIHALQMHAHISPYTRAHAAIKQSKAEAVIIETISIRYGIELVRNDPYLRNRPLIFDIGLLDEGLLRDLCSRMRVTVFDGAQAAHFGIVRLDPKAHFSYERLKRLRTIAESSECQQSRLDG
jgi:hypothetical protein